MTTMHSQGAQRRHDDFGRRVATRLTAGTADLPHPITERLRAARVQAVAQRKPALLARPLRGYALAGAGLGGEMLGFWRRLASALPVMVLVAGLVAIHVVQNEQRASEVAEVDAALLTDDLPPSAYADPGFVEFLRTEH